MWLVAGFTSPLSGQFQSLIIWLWAAIIVSTERASRVPREPPTFAPSDAPVFEHLRRR
jgi:hypothetical protein